MPLNKEDYESKRLHEIGCNGAAKDRPLNCVYFKFYPALPADIEHFLFEVFFQ